MKKILCLTLSLLAAFTSCLTAAPKISGSVNYLFGTGNATVSMGCDALINSSAENATAAIMVKLWAMDRPYSGGPLTGHLLGSYKLAGLNPGAQYSALKKSVTATLPPRSGNYYICLSVSEYQNGAYLITDSRNFGKVIYLAAPKTFTLSGPWTWKSSYEGGTVNMKVAKISHTRQGSTGGLRLALWATSKPYAGGAINGYMLGSVDKKPLKPGFTYNDVDNTAKLKRPPAGNYYVNLVLLEFNGTDYVVMSHLAGAKPVYFAPEN